jgi:two-component system sensor histidine kinase CreC
MTAPQRELFLGNIRGEADRLQRTIDRLLALAAIETRKSLEQPTDIPLVELLDALCANHRHSIEARNLEVRTDYSVRPVIRGEPFLLEMALGNMLQNAVDFSPPGRTITLRLRVEGSRVEIVVDDEGPGVPAYALERVFDRFYSLPHPATGRKSSGLGLCFVREVAALHRGRASLTNRPDRSGARAVLALPTGQ